MFPIIYIVDDDPSMRDSLALLIGSMGYRSEAFADAEAFRVGFEPEHAGCVMLDVRMPRMGGLEALRWIRSSGSAVPVVMISGHADVPTATRAMLDGASDFFEKPFSDQRLIDRINESVRWQEANLERERLGRAIGSRRESLTAREAEVFQGLVAGETSASIAARLGLSRRTVEMHRTGVMKKMAASSIAELVHFSMLL